MDARRFAENLINYLENFIKNDDPNQGLRDRLDKWEKFTGDNYLSFSNKDIVMSRGGLQSCKFWDDFNKASKEKLSTFLLAITFLIVFRIFNGN